MRGNGNLGISGQKLSMPFALATSISNNYGNVSSMGVHFPSDLAISILRMR